MRKTGYNFSSYAKKDYGVSFPQGHLWLAADIAAVKHDETINELKRWLDLYCAADITACVLHCGGDEMAALGKTDAEIQEARVNPLRTLCKHIKGSDTVIWVENLSRFTTNAAELKSLIDMVDSEYLTICLTRGICICAVCRRQSS